YVLRMILRRALRHGKILGMELPFLHKLVDVVIENYGKAYPDLVTNKAKIIDTIKKEEERFNKTLDRGYKLLDEFISANKDIDGESAFKLYDTYGFPFELTKEIAEEKGLKADEAGFKKAMQEQKDRAKAATQKISVTGDIKYAKVEEQVGATDFVGYTESSCDAKILATLDGEGYVDVVLDKTPFYAECGGQVGDSGIIENNNLKLEVLTTFKVNKLFVHRCTLVNGEITVGDTVKAMIDVERRDNIKIHHSSAHILQAALQKVLGKDVHQAGSQVEENRMRFDFNFNRAMTLDEIEKVEKHINTWIKSDDAVTTKVMNIEEAKQTGAMALFGEKYDDEVRVVSIGDFSKEFCAGCHASHTGELRLAKIVSESAIAAGTRRIELVVGDAAFDYMNKKNIEIDKLSAKFKAHYYEVEERIDKIIEENKALQKELLKVKSGQAKEKFNSFANEAISIDGGKLFVKNMEQLDGNALKEGVELLANKLGESVIVVVAGTSMFVKVSDSFVQKGISAGNIVKEIAAATNGKGGGRPQFAQGAVVDLAKVSDALLNIENKLKG
ncbi:MAG: alanine--tRNA ligase, partial [bacterium]|nr:alanine--tRNA ligase [bacterium]